MLASDTIALKTKGHTDVIDITTQVQNCLTKTGLCDGIAVVFVVGSTGAVSTIEYEPGLVKDIKEALEQWISSRREYHHDLRWGDGNGYAHIRAALMGPSLTIPFQKGELVLGTWQQVIFLDFDNRPRNRSLYVQFIGESGS